ncbi:MAG TPA: hypothetical protein VK563_01915 [Puia sp.]|nr:hypothetical protein [Puia sp.]
MKRLLYLFPFYILFLSGVPCSPNDGCCIEEMRTQASTDQPTGNTDNKADTPCSPFFACGANHGVVIPDHQIEFVQPLPSVAKLQFFYTERPLLAFISSVWQPPKSV